MAKTYITIETNNNDGSLRGVNPIQELVIDLSLYNIPYVKDSYSVLINDNKTVDNEPINSELPTNQYSIEFNNETNFVKSLKIFTPQRARYFFITEDNDQYIFDCKIIPITADVSFECDKLNQNIPQEITVWSDAKEVKCVAGINLVSYSKTDYSTDYLTQNDINSVYNAGGGILNVVMSENYTEKSFSLHTGIILSITNSDYYFENCNFEFFETNYSTKIRNATFKNCYFTHIGGDVVFQNCSFEKCYFNISNSKFIFDQCSDISIQNFSNLDDNATNELLYSDCKISGGIKTITGNDTFKYIGLSEVIFTGETDSNLEAENIVIDTCSLKNITINGLTHTALSASGISITNSSISDCHLQSKGFVKCSKCFSPLSDTEKNSVSIIGNETVEIALEQTSFKNIQFKGDTFNKITIINCNFSNFETKTVTGQQKIYKDMPIGSFFALNSTFGFTQTTIPVGILANCKVITSNKEDILKPVYGFQDTDKEYALYSNEPDKKYTLGSYYDTVYEIDGVKQTLSITSSNKSKYNQFIGDIFICDIPTNLNQFGVELDEYIKILFSSVNGLQINSSIYSNIPQIFPEVDLVDNIRTGNQYSGALVANTLDKIVFPFNTNIVSSFLNFIDGSSSTYSYSIGKTLITENTQLSFKWIINGEEINNKTSTYIIKGSTDTGNVSSDVNGQTISVQVGIKTISTVLSTDTYNILYITVPTAKLTKDIYNSYESLSVDFGIELSDINEEYNLEYIWKYKANNSEAYVELENGNQSVYSIDSLEKSDAGFYTCDINYRNRSFLSGGVDSFAITETKEGFSTLNVGDKIVIDDDKTSMGQLTLRVEDTLSLIAVITKGSNAWYEWQKRPNTTEGEWVVVKEATTASTQFNEYLINRGYNNFQFRVRVFNKLDDGSIATEDFSEPVLLTILKTAPTGNEISSNIILCKIPLGELDNPSIKVGENYMVFSSAMNRDVYQNNTTSPVMHTRDNQSLWEYKNNKLIQKYTGYTFPSDLDIDKVSGNWAVATDHTTNEVFILDLKNCNWDLQNQINHPAKIVKIPDLDLVDTENLQFQRLGIEVYIHGNYIAVSDPYTYVKDEAQSPVYTGRVFLFYFDPITVQLQLLKVIRNPEYDKLNHDSFGDCVAFDDYGNILISAPETPVNHEIGYTFNKVSGAVYPSLEMDNTTNFDTLGKIYVWNIDELTVDQDIFKIPQSKQIISSQYIMSTINYSTLSWGSFSNNFAVYETLHIKDVKTNGGRINETFGDYQGYSEWYDFQEKYDFSYKYNFPTKYTLDNFRNGYSYNPQMKIYSEIKIHSIGTSELFGSTMSYNEGRLLIGAPYFNNHQGFIEIWEYSPSTKQYIFKNSKLSPISNPGGFPSSFGINVEMGKDYFLVAYKTSGKVQGVNVYDYIDNIIQDNNINVPVLPLFAKSFGNAMDTYENTFVISSPDEGKIYRYSYDYQNEETIRRIQLIDLEKLSSGVKFGNVIVAVKDHILASYRSYGPSFDFKYDNDTKTENLTSSGAGAILQYSLIGGEFRLV